MQSAQPEEATVFHFRVDMLSEGARDFNAPFLGFGFQDDIALAKTIKDKVVPRYMPIFEEVSLAADSLFLTYS